MRGRKRTSNNEEEKQRVRKLNRKKIALVSLVLLAVLSMSTTVALADYSNTPPYLTCWSSRSVSTSGTGGNSNDYEYVNSGTGYFRLYSMSGAHAFGAIETDALGYIAMNLVQATSSGAVQILGDIALNGSAELDFLGTNWFVCGCSYQVILSYEVYDENTAQFIANARVWQDHQSIDTTGWIDCTYNYDVAFSGSFNAVSGHIYRVDICLELVTESYETIGANVWAYLDFSNYAGANHYALLKYVDLVGPVSFYSSGGGGCPNLLVWNGTAFVDEGLLNIHNLVNRENDVVRQYTLNTTPAVVDHNRYMLELYEHPAGYNASHSWINQVMLYSVDANGIWQECNLVSAFELSTNSSRNGNVLPLLLYNDTKWAQTYYGDKIFLQFTAANVPNIDHFVFVIIGHNMK
jgi:hypothetical protein